MTQTKTRPVADSGSILAKLVISSGSHAEREKGVCAMEAVAWLAGEKHSDRPQCADAGLTRYVQRVNDNAFWDSNEERTQALLPLLLKMLGTADSKQEERSKFMRNHALQWCVPYAFDAAASALAKKGKQEAADKLTAWATKLREEPTVENARLARQEARAAYAADAAYAYADAAAAYAYADAAAAYAADAAAYAYAYAAAADAAASRRAARRKVLFEQVRMVTELLEKYPADKVGE